MTSSAATPAAAARLLLALGLALPACRGYTTGGCDHPAAPCPPLPDTIELEAGVMQLLELCGPGETPPAGAVAISAAELRRLLGPQYVPIARCAYYLVPLPGG